MKGWNTLEVAMAAAALRMNKPLLVAAAKNGRAIACDVDATKFLLAYPRGAYTGARTVDQKRIFDYEGHIKRLVDSTIAMHSDNTVSSHELERSLRPKTEATLRAAMQQFKEHYGTEPNEEYKITLLVCDEQEEQETAASVGSIYCHIGLLPPLRTAMVKLHVAGMPRHNAAAKDSAWVRERKAIYDSLPKDVEEIILMDPDSHQLLEGSQTNFYAIKDGKIYTAEEGILKGTVRGLVLDVCAELGVPVVLEPPTLDTVDTWEGCFISSTSRLVLGTASLEFDRDGARAVRAFERNSILDQIATAVKESVLKKSSVVFD